MPQKIAAGNWKMNGTQANLAEIQTIAEAAQDIHSLAIICPPAHLLHSAASLPGPLAIGGQNCHHAPSGAFTGDISAEQLADCGASYVILGHSERREGYGESDSLVRDKARAALNSGLTPIICLGESQEQRVGGRAIEVVLAQLTGSLPDDAEVIIAYEPIWAIGTGLVPNVAEIAEVHDALRAQLHAIFAKGQDISILYGGSVKPSNAQEIFAITNVNGALVGGASLKAEDFLPIMRSLAES
ncbi:triose-phosphate isomerase [Planktomarina sp.]|jgi:triosephosphate isomerase|nr:triose-phosphate isomerase [Planktomarina sp.]